MISDMATAFARSIRSSHADDAVLGRGYLTGVVELPVEMKFREGGDAAHRFQVQIRVEMPVDMVQHPLHPGLRCEAPLSFSFLRGGIS